MPMKTTQKALSSHKDLESSGDSQNASDFGFTDDEDDDDDEGSDLYDEFSGSGDEETTVPPKQKGKPSKTPFVNSNKIPDMERPEQPAVNEEELVKNSNEIQLRNKPESEEHPSNVLMSHATEDSIFNKTEVLAALIAGGAVGLMFAVLLILLLIYRMKKKDEGSYELGKKPIYKKAPTTEIYA
ncbi:unnamed protein product [Knipowitschia caucasica]